MGVLDHERLYIGLDVGSTTVKAVVVDLVADEVLWQDYERHDTKQPEKCLEFTRIETDFRSRRSASGSSSRARAPAASRRASAPSSCRR